MSRALMFRRSSIRCATRSKTAVDVEGFDVQAVFDLVAHRIGPRFGPEDPHLEVSGAHIEPGGVECLGDREQVVGVHMITSGSNSVMICTWRWVCPPETGMTAQPRRSIPPWAPSPPVNSPYP